MNFKVAVCDDESIICKTIFDIIETISDETGIKFATDCFTSGEELCEELRHIDYDLIFLDIELQKMNGVEVGKYIRENLGNENIQIAYVSSKQQYAMELFEIRPINFIVKPISFEKIKIIIDKFLKINAIDTQIFKFKIGKEHINMPLSDIVYFSSNGRYIILISKNNNFKFYGSLEKIYSEIKKREFLYIHKSFIVNYKYIRQYDYEQVTMIDGTVIPISQPRRKTVRRMILEIEGT